MEKIREYLEKIFDIEGRRKDRVFDRGSWLVHLKLGFFGIGNCITFSLSGGKESDQTLKLWAPLPLLSSLCVWTGYVPEGCHSEVPSENRFPGQ